MLHGGKWHALIRRRRPSSAEFPALASKSCAILRSRLRQQSRNILRKDPGSLREPSKPDQLLFFSFHAVRRPHKAHGHPGMDFPGGQFRRYSWIDVSYSSYLTAELHDPPNAISSHHAGNRDPAIRHFKWERITR